MELFLDGLRGWSGDLRQRLLLSTTETFQAPKRLHPGTKRYN